MRESTFWRGLARLSLRACRRKGTLNAQKISSFEKVVCLKLLSVFLHEYVTLLLIANQSYFSGYEEMIFTHKTAQIKSLKISGSK